MKYTSIDLFSGPGGLATGFRWAGINPLIAVEWSPTTVETYALNHNADILRLEDYLAAPHDFAPSERTIIIHGDVNKVTGDLFKKILRERFNRQSVDIVTGGAPCESFSLAGDRKQVDERNDLFRNILRVARAVDSPMLLFENVKGLFSKRVRGKAGRAYELLCKHLESKEAGAPSYRLVSKDKKAVLLKAVDYGVPQMRERVFLVGINNKFKDASYSYPEPTHGPGRAMGYVSVADAILDLPDVEVGEEASTYSPSDANSPESEWFRSAMRGVSLPAERPLEPLANHTAPNHVDKMLERIKAIRQGESMRTAYERLMAEGREDFCDKVFPRKIYGARNRRLLPDQPSFTVTSHCLDEMIHPSRDRGLTPREAARLQSFPDWYDFQGPRMTFHGKFEQDQYEQVGDAIPPLLAYALAKEIVKTLDSISGN